MIAYVNQFIPFLGWLNDIGYLATKARYNIVLLNEINLTTPPLIIIKLQNFTMESIAFETRTLESTASILLNSVINVLNSSDSKTTDFEDALKPFAVIQWARPIIEKLGIDKINRVFGLLERSQTPKPAPRLIIDHFKTALSDLGGQMPDHLAGWRTILTRYSLNLLADYSTWALVIEFLLTQKVKTPVGFSEFNLEELENVTASSPYCELVRSLWQAVRLDFATAKGVTPFTLQFRPNNFSLLEALRAKNVEESGLGIELANAAVDLQLPENFGRLGPKARIIALQNLAPDSQPLLRFLSVGAQANILEQVRSTLPSVSSGIGCYLSFCSLLAIAPFPPTAEVVAQWSAVFPPGKTFSIYLSHLSKACNLLGFDSSWKNEVILSIAKGIRNRPTGKDKFHNSLEPASLERIIRHESWESEFARLRYVTYLFMLRLPSDALTLTRAIANDKLLATETSSAPSLIGLREFLGEKRLALKLAKRKNTRNAFIATRPCFCGQNALLPRRNCPIRRFWKAVIAHTEPGALLSPSFQGGNFSRVLLAALFKLNIADSERYSPHCFRRGDAAAILNSGATLSEIMRTGGWASSSFKVYLDLHRVEEVATTNVLAGASPASDRSSSVESTSSVSSTPVNQRVGLFLVGVIETKRDLHTYRLLRPMFFRLITFLHYDFFQQWVYTNFRPKITK